MTGKYDVLVSAAEACPFQSWAAFTDDSGDKPHTNLVSFTDHTECVLPLPGLHKNDPLVSYLWAVQPAKVRDLAADLSEASRVLSQVKRMIDEALPKFNWGASHLDANAISLLNEVPIAVNAALGKIAPLEAAQ